MMQEQAQLVRREVLSLTGKLAGDLDLGIQDALSAIRAAVERELGTDRAQPLAAPLAPKRDDLADSRAIKAAKKAILAALAAGPCSDLKTIVVGAEISQKNFERARVQLNESGHIVRRGGGFGGPVVWALSASGEAQA